MRYRDYGTEDFVKDPFFQKWVLSPDAESEGFWRAWSELNPDKYDVMEEARKIIHLLGFSADNHANERLLQTWDVVNEAWGRGTDDVSGRGISIPPALRAAAAIAIIAISAVAIWFLLPRKVIIQTPFRETRAVSLPDGSVVELNANSSIAFLNDWSNSGKREVWLTGEAFFSVGHDPNREFTVHTEGGVHVNVLGTTFNVLSRRHTTRVSLNTGKIKVHLEEWFLPPEENAAEGFVMSPGEVAEFDSNTRTISRKEASVDHYASWKEKKIFFDNTSMKEVAAVLQDTYGINVSLDRAIEFRKITGEFKSDDLDILLRFIARALDAEVVRDDEKIHFRSKATGNK